MEPKGVICSEQSCRLLIKEKTINQVRRSTKKLENALESIFRNVNEIIFKKFIDVPTLFWKESLNNQILQSQKNGYKSKTFENL